MHRAEAQFIAPAFRFRATRAATLAKKRRDIPMPRILWLTQRR